MPDPTPEHRKLAAIMFTDMVGYSALTHHNEKLALEILGEHRSILRELFLKFNGQEVAQPFHCHKRLLVPLLNGFSQVAFNLLFDNFHPHE